jgi:hypothetical protein
MLPVPVVEDLVAAQAILAILPELALLDKVIVAVLEISFQQEVVAEVVAQAG